MKSVNIHASLNDTKRVPMAVSVYADGTKSPAMFIFKGTQNGWIAKKSSQIFQLAVSIISRKMNGWMRVE